MYKRDVTVITICVFEFCSAAISHLITEPEKSDCNIFSLAVRFLRGWPARNMSPVSNLPRRARPDQHRHGGVGLPVAAPQSEAEDLLHLQHP